MDKKFLLVLGLIILLGGGFAYEKFAASPQSTTQVVNSVPQQTVPVSATPAPTTTATAAGFKDGIYIGVETSSLYGKAKAQVVISNGKITDVKFLEYPSDRAASLSKSNMAMPIIKQEIIQAQNANVNTVSGATETSASFIQSIASALSQASA